jgi:two-component system chemotaxis response regulator CheY
MPSNAPITVLLIDDSQLSRTGLRTHFRALRPDWGVDEAGDADQALAMSEIKDYGLFVVDINMPGISGLELVPLLQVRAPQAKIVVVSANTQDAVRTRVQAMGVGFVGKPIKKQTVEQVLEVAGFAA